MKNAGDFPRLFLMKEGIKMINLKDCAPLRAVNRIKRKYPDVFEIIDSLVKEEDFSDMWDHGKVFIPVSGARAAMEHVGDIDFAKDGKDLALVPALAAWRQHKTIYEFAPALTEELFETARRKKLTLDISAIHLPHWAIYVKTGIKMPADIDGFFISYDEDIIEDTGKHYTELRFTPIDKNGIPRHVIYLIVPNNNGEPGSIESCLRRNMKFSEVDERRIEEMMKTGYTEMKEMLNRPDNEKYAASLNIFLAQLVMMAIYLSAENADIQKTEYNRYRRTSHITDTAREIEYFQVGLKIAPRLKMIHNMEKKGLVLIAKTRKSPAMHIRRAHWHTYRYGHGRKLLKVRWIHATLVNAAGDEVDYSKFIEG